eukprot:5779446-Pyramimonas_sp.AAC.1
MSRALWTSLARPLFAGAFAPLAGSPAPCFLELGVAAQAAEPAEEALAFFSAAALVFLYFSAEPDGSSHSKRPTRP